MAKSKINKLQSAEQSKSLAEINMELLNKKQEKQEADTPKKSAGTSKQAKPKKAAPEPKAKKAPDHKKDESPDQIPVDPNQTELFEGGKETTEPDAANIEPQEQEHDAERVSEPERAAAPEPQKNEPAPEEKRTPQNAARKYDEPTRSISFKFPESKIDALKEIANVYGMNTTQYLLMKITQDYDENKDLIEKLREKRRQ